MISKEQSLESKKKNEILLCFPDNRGPVVQRKIHNPFSLVCTGVCVVGGGVENASVLGSHLIHIN